MNKERKKVKIWKAELNLIYSLKNEWETHFYFELQEEEYRENKEFNKWTYFKNWVGKSIPMYMKVETRGYSGISVVQGFDHELSVDELKTLEKDMREKLKEYLDDEKEKYLNEYMKKMKCI